MSRTVIACAIALALAPAAYTAAPVEVHATVDPLVVGLGDPFVYTVKARGPSGMTVFAGAGPFVAVAEPETNRSTSDGVAVVRIDQRLVCLDRGCAPDRRSRRVQLPPARAAGASSSRASIVLRPRVPVSAVTASRARYRIDPNVPASGAPWTLATVGLGGFALLVLAAAAFLTLRATRPRVAAAGRARAGGLEQALRLLRESARRPASDRRRAADYVARAAAARGGDAVADDATRVAWSAPDPVPPEVSALADRIESTLGSDA